jgi:uncharacterized protein (TIGR00725 family)
MSTGSSRLDCLLRSKRFIGVIGAADCDEALAVAARAIGRGIAETGAVLVCGGMGGVMRAACQGAKEAGGLTVGILPGVEITAANEFVDLPIATGLGEARNLIIIRTASLVVAIGGSYGTLSEIGFALKMGKMVVGFKTWDIQGVEKAGSVEAVLEKLKLKEDKWQPRSI